jgi:hypothetical protein
MLMLMVAGLGVSSAGESWAGESRAGVRELPHTGMSQKHPGVSPTYSLSITQAGVDTRLFHALGVYRLPLLSGTCPTP